MRLFALLLLVVTLGAAEEPEEWYSHRQHAALKLPCTHCHPGAGKSARAGMPAAGRCLECHKAMEAATPVLKRLRGLAPAARPFQPQYDNLPEYVIFSHTRHTRAKIACESCHGKVTEQAQMEPANALNMKACVECHQAHGARTGCRLCHHINAAR